MTMPKDEWVKAAMSDDKVVVELLMRLKQQSSSKSSSSLLLQPMKLKWGLRQPRSRMNSLRFENRKKVRVDCGNSRGSPTTPFSWSGGGSGSGGGASTSGTPSSDQSTRFPSSLTRSKVTTATCEPTSNISSTKKSKRKKTFAELKEEESSLLKERIHLQKDIATLQSTLQQQTARNECLKRMKFDMGLYSTNDTIANAEESKETLVDQHNQMAASTSTMLRPAACEAPTTEESCHAPKDVSSSSHSPFILPDLNMMPSEE